MDARGPVMAVVLTGLLSAAGYGSPNGVRPPAQPATAGRANAGDAPALDATAGARSTSARPRPDFSGRKRVGIASFYAGRFAGRKMANGARMDPHGNNAASRTLPLGTIAKVTNMQTGRSALISIQDRGPYVKGRLVDLSPATARKIGITVRQGLAPVQIAPIAVPLPGGRVKPGVGAQEIRSYLADTQASRERKTSDQ